MVDEPKTLEDWKEIGEAYFELCELLHNNSKLIPEELMSKIEDVLYRHFEP